MTAEECIDKITGVLSSGVNTIAPGGTDLVDRLMDISSLVKEYYKRRAENAWNLAHQGNGSS